MLALLYLLRLLLLLLLLLLVLLFLIHTAPKECRRKVMHGTKNALFDMPSEDWLYTVR
jgi:cell division protein FtsN